TVQLVNVELVLYEKIGNDYLISPAAEASGWCTSYAGALGRQHIDRLRSAKEGSNETSAEQIGPAERQQPGIRAGRRPEPGHEFCLFPINYPHREELVEETQIPGLKNEQSLIPSHSGIPRRYGLWRLGASRFHARCVPGRAP